MATRGPVTVSCLPRIPCVAGTGAFAAHTAAHTRPRAADGRRAARSAGRSSMRRVLRCAGRPDRQARSLVTLFRPAGRRPTSADARVWRLLRCSPSRGAAPSCSSRPRSTRGCRRSRWSRSGWPSRPAFLLVLLRLSGGRLPRSREALGRAAGLSLFNVAIPFVLIAWGAQHIPSALAAIFNGTVPLFSIVLAALLLHDEPITLNRLGGLLLGFAGALVLASPNLGSAAGGHRPDDGAAGRAGGDGRVRSRTPWVPSTRATRSPDGRSSTGRGMADGSGRRWRSRRPRACWRCPWWRSSRSGGAPGRTACWCCRPAWPRGGPLLWLGSWARASRTCSSSASCAPGVPRGPPW